MGPVSKEQHVANGTRPSWSEYFLGIAESVSVRGDCTRSRVGAVLATPDKRVLSVGYNGTSERKDRGCLEGSCPRGQLSYSTCPAEGSYSNCIAVHAEDNAIRFALESVGWREVWRCTLYVTRKPCEGCLEYARRKGIAEIIWPEGSVELDAEGA